MEQNVPATEKAGIPPKLASLRFKLGDKAKREPEFRFYALYGHLLRVDVLETAFALVASRKGANTAGVDGLTVDQIVSAEGGEREFLGAIRQELQAKTYRPQAVKRVYIDKGDGKKRPLGIPTVRDRVTQAALLLLLEPILDADFLDCSHGFRPGRSAHGAVTEVQALIRQGYTSVYDADLKGYFDSIPHDKLMKGVEQRISDGSVLKLIRLFLRAPVQEQGAPLRRPESGTPQGGVLSPLLANSFLHWFDRAFFGRMGPGTWAKAHMVRYADDFVILARYIDARIIGWVEATIEGRLGLEINREKTSVVNLHIAGTTLDFLGYRFRKSRSHRAGGGPPYWRLEPSPKAMTKARAALRELTGPRYCFMPLPLLVNRMNQHLRGWLRYFSLGHPKQARWNIVRFAESRIARHLGRRSQRPFRPPEGTSVYDHMHSLGLVGVSATIARP